MIVRFFHSVWTRAHTPVCIINSLDSIWFRRLLSNPQWKNHKKWNNFGFSFSLRRQKWWRFCANECERIQPSFFKHIQLLSEAIAKLFAGSLWWYKHWMKARNNTVIKWKSGVGFATMPRILCTAHALSGRKRPEEIFSLQKKHQLKNPSGLNSVAGFVSWLHVCILFIRVQPL